MNDQEVDELVFRTSDVFQLGSDEQDQLNAALAAAQPKMSVIKQSGVNPHFKSKYSTIVDVWNALYGSLNECGLSVTVQPIRMDGEWVARGVLRHKSGQWIAGFLPLLMMKRDMQAMKSAMTYAQRTLTIALTGAASGEDDDGNAACEQPTAAEKTSAVTEKALAKLTDAISASDIDEANKLVALIKLRESEKAVAKGTAARAVKMFSEAFPSGDA